MLLIDIQDRPQRTSVNPYFRCPLCGSSALARRGRTGDVLDVVCVACGEFSLSEYVSSAMTSVHTWQQFPVSHLARRTALAVRWCHSQGVYCVLMDEEDVALVLARYDIRHGAFPSVSDVCTPATAVP